MGVSNALARITYILISFISAQILLSVADVTLQESENKKMINVRKE